MVLRSNPRFAAPAAPVADDTGDLATLGVDGILDRLEQVVKQLESGELPLEGALARFEDGVRLARRGSELLDAVEQRVETLLADRNDEGPPGPQGSDEV